MTIYSGVVTSSQSISPSIGTAVPITGYTITWTGNVPSSLKSLTIDQIFSSTKYSTTLSARVLVAGITTTTDPPLPSGNIYNVKLTKNPTDSVNVIQKDFTSSVVTGSNINILSSTVIGAPNFIPGYFTFTNTNDPGTVTLTQAQVYLDFSVKCNGHHSHWIWIIIGVVIFIIILAIIIWAIHHHHKEGTIFVNQPQKYSY